MAILQALFAVVAKSAGKILNAIFGWAVRALFGRTSARERTFLSGLVAAAAAWPLLLVGLVAPKLAALLLAFVPIPHWVPSWVVRLVWLGLMILVPLAIGIAMAAKAPPAAPRRSVFRRLLSGFPITIGLALAFLIMFVTVPVMRLWALLRGQDSRDVPLVTEASGYHELAGLVIAVLNRRGFDLKTAPPSWSVAAPTRVLRCFGGDAFSSFVPRRLENYVGGDLTVSFYPSGILLRGKGHALTWAHGLIAEATARGDGFQTTAPVAQEVEKQITRLWKVYLDEPEAHANSARLLARAGEIAGALATAEIDFDDWQVIYRKLLQLDRALHGQAQLLEEKTERSGLAAPAVARSTNRGEANMSDSDHAQNLSTISLVKEIAAEITHLAQKEIELATTELRADLKAEAGMVGGLGVAATAGLTTVNLLLVTVVLVLARSMAGWKAGLLVSGFTLAAGAVIAAVAWNKRVRSPLLRTRRTMNDDLQWSKERLI